MAYRAGTKAVAAAVDRVGSSRGASRPLGKPRRSNLSRLFAAGAMLTGVAAVVGVLLLAPLAASRLMTRSIGVQPATRGSAIERPAPLRVEPRHRLAQAASFPAFAGATSSLVVAAVSPPAAEAEPDAPPVVVAAGAPDASEIVTAPQQTAVLEAAPPPATSSLAPPRRQPTAASAAPAPRPGGLRLASVPAPDAAAPREEPSAVQRLFAALTPAARQDDVTGSISAYAPADHLPRQDSLPRKDDHRTAVYDIVGRTVHMPNGERLEAHSGLGKGFDNPAFSHVRMRGPTPPQTYRLTMRERLFHGVAAIRLTPIGEETMHGRDGMLAHTYMLGPRGESNGCVSFKDYAKFLAAFRRGEVTHMIVVARLTGSPASVIAARRATSARYAASSSGTNTVRR